MAYQWSTNGLLAEYQDTGYLLRPLRTIGNWLEGAESGSLGTPGMALAEGGSWIPRSQ